MERPAMCVPTQVYSCAPVCLSLWEGRAPLALSVGSTARWAAASSSATMLQGALCQRSWLFCPSSAPAPVLKAEGDRLTP